MKLQCSIWSYYFPDLTPEEKIDAFLRGGFTEAEFSDEDGQELLARGKPEVVGREYLAYAKARGFSFPQGHLWLKVDITSGQDAIDGLKRWLDLFLALEIRSGVLHVAGDPAPTAEELFEPRVRALEQLTSYIKGSDLTICLENLWGPNRPKTADELNTLIDAVGDDNLGICLDTGHLNISAARGVGQPQSEFIRKAGKRLKALHIADNDGSGDQHLMPYGLGTINWDEVLTAFSEVGYDRLFNLELPGEIQNKPLEILEHKLAYLRQVCDFMVSRIG